MPPTRSTRASTKRSQIKETAQRLFQAHGIKRITVEEICRTAGVSKMTFYKYFANKKELVQTIWDAGAEALFNKLDEISALEIPFPEKLEALYRWKWSLASRVNPEFLEEFIDVRGEMEKFALRFREFVIESQKKGDIRPEIKPEFIMATMDKLSELGRDARVRGLYPDLESFNRELKDFLWSGLLPRG